MAEIALREIRAAFNGLNHTCNQKHKLLLFTKILLKLTTVFHCIYHKLNHICWYQTYEEICDTTLIRTKCRLAEVICIKIYLRKCIVCSHNIYALHNLRVSNKLFFFGESGLISTPASFSRCFFS